MSSHEHALITQMDATDLIGRVVANTHGAEFVVTGLEFSAGYAGVVILMEGIDEDTGRLDGHQVGCLTINGWSIHNKFKKEEP
jgi:hypothetical protein